MGEENYRFHDHEKLAHLCRCVPLISNLNSPFDSKNSKRISLPAPILTFRVTKNTQGKKLQYFDPERNENYVPYVVETSVGLDHDRMFLAVFSWALREEKLEDGSERTVLKLPAVLAPTKVAVLPLVKKDGLPPI